MVVLLTLHLFRASNATFECVEKMWWWRTHTSMVENVDVLVVLALLPPSASLFYKFYSVGTPASVGAVVLIHLCYGYVVAGTTYYLFADAQKRAKLWWYSPSYVFVALLALNFVFFQMLLQ